MESHAFCSLSSACGAAVYAGIAARRLATSGCRAGVSITRRQVTAGPLAAGGAGVRPVGTVIGVAAPLREHEHHGPVEGPFIRARAQLWVRFRTGSGWIPHALQASAGAVERIGVGNAEDCCSVCSAAAVRQRRVGAHGFGGVLKGGRAKAYGQVGPGAGPLAIPRRLRRG